MFNLTRSKYVRPKQPSSIRYNEGLSKFVPIQIISWAARIFTERALETSYVLDPLAPPNRAEPIDRKGRLLPWRWDRSLTRDILGPYGLILGAVALLATVLGHALPEGQPLIVTAPVETPPPPPSNISPQPEAPSTVYVPPPLPDRPAPPSAGVPHEAEPASPKSPPGGLTVDVVPGSPSPGVQQKAAPALPASPLSSTAEIRKKAGATLSKTPAGQEKSKR
jgi:hypothetical protein